jgi:hypothetical protein
MNRFGLAIVVLASLRHVGARTRQGMTYLWFGSSPMHGPSRTRAPPRRIWPNTREAHFSVRSS